MAETYANVDADAQSIDSVHMKTLSLESSCMKILKIAQRLMA